MRGLGTGGNARKQAAMAPVTGSGWARGFPSLWARIFWTIIPIFVALLIVHGVMDLREHRRLVTDQFMKRGEAMAVNLAYSGELGVFAEDPRLLESSMRGIVGDPDVAYLFIYSEDGRVLAKGGKQVAALEGTPWQLSPDGKARVLQSRRPFAETVGGGRFAEFIAPILSEEGKTPDELILGPLARRSGQAPQPRQRVLGIVRLGLSLQSIEEHVMALVKLWAGVTTVFFGVSTLVVYGFSRRITQPVKRLTAYAHKIAEGFLDQVIPVDSRDEVGQLATTFNEMTRALKGNISEKERILEELRNLNRTLEDRIRERTAELEERSAALQHSLEEVRAMSEISRAVSSSLDLQQVLDTVAARAVGLSHSDACGIFEISPARAAFTVLAAHNLSATFVERLQDQAVDPRQSVVSQATAAGQALQIPDLCVAEDFALRHMVLEAGFRAMLAVPIGTGGAIRGIVLYRRDPVPFDDRTVQLVATLANQSKVAIENARFVQQIEGQRIQLEDLSKSMEQLYRLSTALQEPLSLKEQLSRVLEAARHVVAIDRFHLWVLRPDGDRLVNLAGAGFSDEEWKESEGVELPLAEAGAMATAYRQGHPLLFNEDNPLPPALRLKPPYAGLSVLRTNSFLVVPMIARGQTVGLLSADNKRSHQPISARTIELLQIFASHAAVAIENARLFQELEEKGHQLEIASRHKSQFLANMSHELRTPLNAILGYVELILDNIFGEVPEPIRDSLGRVRTNGLHLLGLINDVLDLSKIEAGQRMLSVGEYSMGDVIQTVITAVRPLASEKQLALRATVPADLPVGEGDERRLAQVLLNLIGNAIKFTEAGEIRVEATFADDTFVVSVADTGPGISPAEQQRIFEEFHQVDSSSTRLKGGTGLGLSIAKQIIELHKGRIWVESSVGKGSTFWFSVPARVGQPVESR